MMSDTAPCGVFTIDDCPCCESASGLWGRCPLNNMSSKEYEHFFDSRGLGNRVAGRGCSGIDFDDPDWERKYDEKEDKYRIKSLEKRGYIVTKKTYESK